jgi:hypothetical protein
MRNWKRGPGSFVRDPAAEWGAPHSHSWPSPNAMRHSWLINRMRWTSPLAFCCNRRRNGAAAFATGAHKAGRQSRPRHRGSSAEAALAATNSRAGIEAFQGLRGSAHSDDKTWRVSGTDGVWRSPSPPYCPYLYNKNKKLHGKPALCPSVCPIGPAFRSLQQPNPQLMMAGGHSPRVAPAVVVRINGRDFRRKKRQASVEDR